jgi:electron transfer flavoprotein alpha/beta subunit
MTSSMQPLQIAVTVRHLRERPGHASTSRILGRYSRAALATARTLVQASNASVVAIAIGPMHREEAALAETTRYGCQRALCVSEPGLDTLDYYGTAAVLAAATASVSANLILCGDRSEDEANGCVGPAMAHHLGIPCLTGVVGVTLSPEDNALRVVRRTGNRLCEYRVTGPTVLAIASATDDTQAPSPSPADVQIELPEFSSLGVDPELLEERRTAVANFHREPAEQARIADNAQHVVAALRAAQQSAARS